jgi:hypothetical protein
VRTLAWAAGLFEGEGSITWNRAKGKGYVVLLLSMTDGDVVRRFHGALGLGRLNGPYRRGLAASGNPRKPLFYWSASGFEHVQAIVAMFWPWLGDRRRARACEVLAIGSAAPVLPRFRTHCPKGHPYTGRNLIVSKKHGYRNCRTCTYEANNKSRRESKP